MFQKLANSTELKIYNAASNHGLVHNGFSWK